MNHDLTGQDKELVEWINSLPSNKKPFFIEVIGPPGSGKSTLACKISTFELKNTFIYSNGAHVKIEFSILNIKSINFLYKIYNRIALVVFGFVLSVFYKNGIYPYYKRLINNSLVPTKIKKSRLRMWLASYKSYHKKSKKSTYIYDEGLIYRSVSLSQSGCKMTEITQYLDFLPTPDALIFINTPTEVIERRLKDRVKKVVNHENLMQESDSAIGMIMHRYKNVEKFIYSSEV